MSRLAGWEGSNTDAVRLKQLDALKAVEDKFCFLLEEEKNSYICWLKELGVKEEQAPSEDGCNKSTISLQQGQSVCISSVGYWKGGRSINGIILIPVVLLLR